MNRLIFAIAAMLLIGWSGFWVLSSWTLKNQIEDWFAERRVEGWQAEYEDLTVRGFPSRLDATLTGVRLDDPARGLSWEAPFFQILGLTYRPGHLILVWPDKQELTLPSGPVSIGSQGLRASLVHTAEGRVLRANLETDRLSIDGPKRSYAFDTLRGAATGLATAPGRYRIGLDDSALTVQAEIGFDDDWTLGALIGPPPQPQTLDLRLAEYRLSATMLRLTGTLTTDAGGGTSGEMTLWTDAGPRMVTTARKSGLLSEAEAIKLAEAFRNQPGRAEYPLVFENGTLRLGQVPLGAAPSLRLP